MELLDAVVLIDDIDRESLVKDIEQIRRALGSISNNTEQSALNYDLDEEQVAERDSEESDDELAIIKSPRYIENEDEETLLGKQRIPIEVISMESVEAHEETPQKHTEDRDSRQIKSCQITGTVELTPIKPNQQEITEASQEATYQASSNDFNPISREVDHSEYTLTELQPTNKDSNRVSIQSHDVCWSPENEMGYPMSPEWQQRTTLDVDIQFVRARQQGCGDDINITNSPRELGSLEGQNDGVEYVEEESEVHRCLNLNRRYQAVIEEELRRTERSLLENRELQLGLTHMTQSALTQAEALAFRQLTFFSKPYFKGKSRQSAPDNEDTKARKGIGQPSPFERPPKPWGKEEINVLSDAVKSAVLEAKLTPLIQRVEVLTPRKCKTEEEQREIQELTVEMGRMKDLPLPTLVQNYTLPIDWEDIADKVLPFRTPFQCQVYWYNELHPLLNKGTWAKDEDKQLVKIIHENNNTDWDKIARELMTNRSGLQCLRRYQRNLNKSFLKSKWEEDEDRQLVEAVKICGVGAWGKVSTLLDGRTGSQCMHRYMKSAKPDIKKGKWDVSEDNVLRKAVEKFGSNWAKIRSYMIPHRTDSQIRERWSDVLDPTLNKNDWTAEEDEMLLKIVVEQGAGNWTRVANHMKGRNDNRCCRRWKYLQKFGCQGDEEKSKETGRSCGPRKKQKPERLVLSSRSSPLVRSKAAATAETSLRGNKRKKATSPLNTKEVEIPRIERSATTRLLKKSRNTKSCRKNKSCNNILKSSSLSKKAAKNRVTADTSHKEASREKRTEPNATVVAQASALPNALPMTYLTQFSVLLQAFSVDVSGALKNINPPNPQTSSQIDSDCLTLSASGRSCELTPDEPSSLEIQKGSCLSGATNENNDEVNRPAGNKSTCDNGKKTNIANNSSPTRRCGKSKTTTDTTRPNMIKNRILADGNDNIGTNMNDNIGTNMSDGSTFSSRQHTENVNRERPMDSDQCPTRKEPVNDSSRLQEKHNDSTPIDSVERGTGDLTEEEVVKITRKTDIESKDHTVDNIELGGKVLRVFIEKETNISKNQRKCIDDCDASRSQVNISDEESSVDINASYLSPQEIVTPEVIVNSVPEVTSLLITEEGQQTISSGEEVRDRDKQPNELFNVIFNQEQPKEDDSSAASLGVVLSDSRHGLTHDIVFTPDAAVTDAVIVKANAVQALNIRRGRSKRKSTVINDTNKRQKTVSDGNINLTESGITTDNANVNVIQTDTLAKYGDTDVRSRYPVRSTRGQPKTNQSFAEKESLAKKPTLQDKSPSKGAPCTTRVHAPGVPPLPPSTTTLNAFKKLLVLRKELQRQADTLKHTSKKRTAESEGTRDGNQKSLKRKKTPLEARTNATYVKNPQAELCDAYAADTLGSELRNCLPYQQLVNRFKSLFLWPGFLSIVNPESVSNKDKQTTKGNTSVNQ